MSTVASTVTGGIQEISALLPLLGTEQCEEHTGSALGKGYFYTGITPISIFGSLGIVKAGFNVLVAGIVVPSWGFLGAQRLADGGFRPRGEVASLIALDPNNPHRFLAESNLEDILGKEHIENVEDLKVNWAEGSLRWNVKMAIFTLTICSLGITPYIYVILRPKNPENPLFLSGWAFPVARVLASSVAGIVIQFIIQIRILVIIKNRLLFISMDQYMKKQTEEWNQCHIKAMEGHLPHWNAGRASELCLWELQEFLDKVKYKPSHPFQFISDRIHTSHQNRGMDFCSLPTTNAQKSQPDERHATLEFTNELDNQSYDYSPLRRHFKVMRKHHFPEIRFWKLSLADIIHTWTYFFLHVALLVALIVSVLGYVGSFNLIQNSGRQAGPILWLALEALLCFLRIGVWAWNPDVDDNKGVAFKISLASKSPLVTCNIYGEDLETFVEAPVVRSKDFLGEIASYTGPLPAFNWSDTALYYILTGSEYSESEPANKALYIVISDFKEQTSRLAVKRTPKADFSFLKSVLKPDHDSTVITVETSQTFSSRFNEASNDMQSKAKTEAKTHVLTADHDFMEQLSKHYDMIMSRINDTQHELDRTFYSSWALQRIDAPAQGSSNDKGQPKLTTADMHYLNHGRLNTRRDIYTKRLEKWITDYMKIYTQELLEEVPYGSLTAMSKLEGIETNEVEYLIVEARRQMELLLLNVLKQWKDVIDCAHDLMMDNVVEYFGTSQAKPTQTLHSLRSISRPKVDATAATVTKLKRRLLEEKEQNFIRVSVFDWERMRRRISVESDLARQRIIGRKHLDPEEGYRVINTWRSHFLDGAWGEYVKIPHGASTETLPSNLSNIGINNGTGDYLDDMSKRMAKKSRFLQGLGESLKGRCELRFTQWEAKLALHKAEFQMLAAPEFLPDASFSPRKYPATRKYWTTQAIRERLKIIGRQLKYLIVDDDLLDDIGGFDNLGLALKQSSVSMLYFTCKFRVLNDGSSHLPVHNVIDDQEASVLKINSSDKDSVLVLPNHDLVLMNDGTDDGLTTDFEDSLFTEVDDPLASASDGEIPREMGPFLPRLLEYSALLDIVTNARMLTGVHFSDKTYRTSSGIQEILKQHIDEILSKPGLQRVCEFEDIEVSDHLRHNKPYVLFSHSKTSKCTVTFYVDVVVDHSLTLTHSFKTIEGEIDIKLNGRRLAKTKGSRQRSTNEFHDEHFHISSKRLKHRPQNNTITITMMDRPSEQYYLSDVVINPTMSQTSGLGYFTQQNLFTEPDSFTSSP